MPVAPDAVDEKSFKTEILVKEFSKYQEPSINELSLFPTEQDLWLPQLVDPDSKQQTSFANAKEHLHYCIDRQIQATVKHTETVIDQEIKNLEPVYIKGTGEFKEFGAWSSKTVKVLGVKVLQVGEPSIG